jgi:hypothetical protein
MLRFPVSTTVSNTTQFDRALHCTAEPRLDYVGFVRVAGQKPVLDALYNDTTEVGCSGCVDKVFLLLSDEWSRQVVRDW